MKLVRKYERELRKAGSPTSTKPAITYEGNTSANGTDPLVVVGDSTAPTSTLFKESDLKLESLVEVLTKQLQRGRVETKLAVLRWIYHLFNICRPKVRRMYLSS